MPTAIHSFSQEEMMAYLDGELAPERALAAAQHLAQCRDCQRLASDFRDVSQYLGGWAVEAPASEAPKMAKAAVRAPRRVGWQQWRVALVSLAAAVLLVVVATNWPGRTFQGSSVNPNRQDFALLNSPRMTAPLSSGTEPESRGKIHLFARAERTAEPSAAPQVAVPSAPAMLSSPPLSSGPLIVRTAQLNLTSKSLGQGRANVERIVKARFGYISQLEVNTSAGAGQTLNATLRVPASQLDLLLQDLKTLGHVDQELQRGEDVTEHSVDLAARLGNMRTTETRLLQLLQQRTGKLADVLEVEESVDRTRGEIEAAEAEQKLLSTQISLATVELRMSEEYKVALDGNPTSTSNHLRNAAIQGFRNAIDSVIGVVSFLLWAGPVLLLVGVAALWPARWLLRNWRARRLS